MADNNIFFVNGVETSSAAEVQTALAQATSGISISVWNGDIAFSGDHTSAGAINLNVGGTSDGTYEGGSTTNWCTEFQKDNTLSSTVTFNSDFKGTVTVFTGTNSENDAYSDSTAENANMRLIFDGAEVTGGNFYNFNYGYIEFKNGAKFDNKNGTGHIRGDVLVTGEGTDVKIALERVYGDDFGADNIVTATLTVADGARFYDTVGDANVLNLGKTASNRQGKIIINGGTFQSKCTIAPATYGTISISNSTVNGKTYYGKMLLDSTAGNPTLNFSGAAANALTISVNSADYADLKESYKIIELADPDSTLDMSKISVTVDGAAYTLGTTFADRYSINQVDNDLVLTYTPPPPIKVINPDSTTQGFDSLVAANTFAEDGAVIEFTTSAFTDTSVLANSESLIVDKDITFKGKTTATFGITGTGYLMFGNTTTSKAINVTVAEGSDVTFSGTSQGVNFRYGKDANDKKIASTLTVNNARMATEGGISSNGLITVKGAGVKGTYGIGKATDDTLDAKYLVANLATKNVLSIKDRFDNYADDVALRLTDYAYVVAVNGISIGSEDGTITSIVSVENSKIELINSSENSSCAFNFAQAHGNKLQISGDSEVLVKEFNFAKQGIITIDGVDAYVRAAKITVADGASATLNVTLTTEQLAAQSLEPGVNTAIFEISGDGDNLLDTTVMLDGAAYTLGDEIVDDAGNKYVIKMGDANGDSVENDLILSKLDPYLISSQVISTDTAFNGTAKAYYTEAKTIITIAEGATMTIGSGANFDLMGTSNNETYAYMLVGGNDYFTGYTGTGTGNLVVDGNLTAGYFNAINGTATVNGTANVMNTNAEGGSFVINGALETINLKIRASSSVTVNGLGSIKLTGSAAGFTQDNTADNFLFNITDADLAGMTGDTHTLLNVTMKENTAVTADLFTVKLNGAAYTLGEEFSDANGNKYVINFADADGDSVANDLVIRYVDPYMLNSQNFVTDTTLSGTDKAYYRNPDENYSGFKSIYNVGSGSTLTIAEGVAVDLQRDPGGTKSIILVGANNYFASQGFEATGAGNLVVNGTLDVGQLNAMADGTITVNGELNITTACIEKGSLIYNSGSTGVINCLNIFNNANATVTVNGLATITLAGEPAHALKDNGATDIASRFVVNVTDADLAAMTGDTHTILNVKSSSVSIADKFTVKLNGAAYTLGEEFSDANGSKYVINFADAGGDSTANDLVIEVTVRKPNLSTSDVYVGNLTGKDGVAVHDTANKLTVFESDGTMSVPVWGLGDWDMLDIADVNGDGVDDILISYQHDNGVTGVAALINQKDGSYGMVHQDIRGWSNDLWEYLCSADVNGDGTEDILTIETDSIAAGRDKNVNAWIMDINGQYSEDMRICGKNTDWEIEGFGDVTGDGKADGILRFKKLVAFWEHDGEKDSVLKEVGQMSTSWKVIGSDDFTGDGLADILFGNSSAQYKLWTDIDEKSYTEINLGTMKNSSLELAGIGDFNGDGKADILWQAADGGLHWGEAQAGKLNNLTTIA